MSSTKRGPDFFAHSTYNTFESETRSHLKPETLEASLKKLGNSAEWYHSLKLNLNTFIQRIQPTPLPWDPAFFSLSFFEMIATTHDASWPFGLNKTEEKSLEKLLSDLNKITDILIKNNYKVAPRINIYYYRYTAGCRNRFNEELNKKRLELNWLFSADELSKIFGCEKKEEKPSTPLTDAFASFFDDTPPVVSNIPSSNPTPSPSQQS